MTYKPWSVAIAWLVTFGLFGLASVGGIGGTQRLVTSTAAFGGCARRTLGPRVKRS